MADRNLQELLGTVESPVELLRNAQVGPNVYPGVPAEFTNWRDEQQAWQQTCVLYNQSFHMAELMVEGPDALALLTSLGVNSFATFEPGKAKQLVPCTPDGYVIGDVILFALAADRYNLVGRAPVLNWVSYHAETAGHDVEVQFDQRTALRTDGLRRHYRFQVQGPNAMAVLEKALGHAPEELKFFNMRTEQIAGVEVCALRHGMAGQPGWELFGPWEDYEAVHEALVSAGQDLGLTLVGGRAYGSNAIESGWIPSPLPAIYTSEEMRDYREWLPANGYEATNALAGSFVSDKIEDYYLNPWELGYGSFVKFDHDFVGRDALEAIDPATQRRKVTLAWNDEDLTKLFGSLLGDAPGYQFFDLPNANYGSSNFDSVVDADGHVIGASLFTGYSANERKGLSLATVDPNVPLGAEVRVMWGEPDGGSRKTTVEPHEQFAVRAIVSPAPYAETARGDYHGGWRSAATA
jgi:vanillate/3-O-methylgallate O-demethylase